MPHEIAMNLYAIFLTSFQVLGLGCDVVFVAVQPGASSGHPHFGPSNVFTHYYPNNSFKLPYDDHAVFRTNRIYRVSLFFAL